MFAFCNNWQILRIKCGKTHADNRCGVIHGRQFIEFRGHRYYESMNLTESPPENDVNFKSVLRSEPRSTENVSKGITLILCLKQPLLSAVTK